MRLIGDTTRCWGRGLLLFGMAWGLWALPLRAEWRIWNSKVGTEVEAQYISQTETHVVLKTKAGAQITVDKAKLSDNDQEFLKWLAEDAKKPAAKTEEAAKGSEPAKASDPAKTKEGAKPAPTKSAPNKSAAKDRSVPSVEPPPAKPVPATPTLPGQPPGTRPLEKPDPDKLEIPYITYPYSGDFYKQKPLAEPPGTDYEKLARELCAPVPTPVFAALHKFKIPLVNPATAQLAQAGNYLVDHNDKQETLDVWNLDTGKLVNSIKVGPLANPRCFAISPAGSFVGLGRDDQAIVAYHVVTGKTMCVVGRLAGEGRKVVRVAFNWEEDEVFVLTDQAEIDRQLLLGPQSKRHTFRGSLPEEMRDYAANNDEIWLTVSGNGRVGARLTDRFTYACYVQTQHAGFKALAHRTYLAMPVRNGIVYWSRNELTRYGVRYSTKLEEPKQKMDTVKHRAIDCIDFVKHSLDRRDQYLWVTNEKATGTLDIYDLDCFDVPVRVRTPVQVEGKQQHWHSSASRRLYYYQPEKQELTVHQLQQFEPPPQWKLQAVFHRGLLEKRYDKLEGLAEVLARDMRPLQGGKQMPVLTEVVKSFVREQFYVPYDEWQRRMAHWAVERPNSQIAVLVLANHWIEFGRKDFRNRELPRKNQRPTEGQLATIVNRAANCVEIATKMPKPYGEALYLELRLAPLLGWEKDKLLELAARMAQVAPDHTEFHHEMCLLLLPEQRGELDETELYAKTIADHFPEEQGDILYGQMVYRLLLMMDDEDFAKFLKFDLARATRGLVADAKKHPNDATAITRAQDWNVAMHRAKQREVLEPFKEDFRPISTAYVRLLTSGTWNAYLRPRD